MMHLKNIAVGNAKTPEQYQLTRRAGVIWLFSEEGKNWYEEQRNFASDSLKVAYDGKGIIVCINTDVSAINPTGLSVVELPNITANRRADNSGQWMYQDGKIVKRAYTDDELMTQAEGARAQLMLTANQKITPLQDALDLDMATDEELAQLNAWKTYRVLLSRVVTSTAPDIDWPPLPA